MRAFSCLPLPKELKAKQECLNIQNNDKKYFLWCILASLHPVQHGNYPTRVSKNQEHEHELNMSGIQYPVDIKDMEKFKLHWVQRVKLPQARDKKGRDKFKFTKTEYQLRLPFVIYTDLENFLCKQDLCKPSSLKSSTTHYQPHVPCGSCICSDRQCFVNMWDDVAEKVLD